MATVVAVAMNFDMMETVPPKAAVLELPEMDLRDLFKVLWRFHT